jgi:hypothetical protein
MIRHICKHWLTSLIGAIGGAASLIAPAVLSGTLARSDYAIAFVLLVVGLWLKDPKPLDFDGEIE